MKGTILVVEDDLDSSNMLRELLGMADYAVESAETADDCVMVTFPFFFDTVCTVLALMRVRATVSASGLFPVIGTSLPS